MKKVFLVVIMLFANMMLAFAQDDIVLYITDYPSSQHLCIENNQRVIIYAQEGCPEFHWGVNGQTIWNESPLIIDSQNSGNYWDPQNGHYWYIVYSAGLECDYFSHTLVVEYHDSDIPNEFTQIKWKRQSETDSLAAVGHDSISMGYHFNYDFLWSTGETTRTIDVTEPGTYSVEITGLCGTVTRTFIVKDNVELYRATVDLASGLNKVTWQTTPEQAEYISQVKVERDGFVVGTAPYEDGQFMDNIGSENAARNYRLTGITTEGTECPIPSYQYGTLHVDYSPNASNPNKLNMAWTPPYIEEGAPISLSYFQICKYDPVTDEVTVVDQLGANNTIGSYDVNLFDGGYAVVAAMFNEGKDYDERSYSNLTDFLLGIGENEGQQCRVYPNPAKDSFTVEGTGILHVTNVLGQEIMAKEIDGKETVALPKGLYFVKLNGIMRKVVVE